jgi:hypothetical protein
MLCMHEFGRELRYGLAAEAIAAVECPLDTAVLQIQNHPQHLQSLLLSRILSALAFGVGQFRRAEVFGLDRATRALAVALMNLRESGAVPAGSWEGAVDHAGAAQLGLQRTVTPCAPADDGANG